MKYNMAEALMPWVLMLAALCAVLYLLGFCYRATSGRKTIVKTTSVAALAVVTLLVQTPIWLSIALIFCALGDYYLSRKDQANFLKGVGAFAVGHLFFIVLFLQDPLSELTRIGQTTQLAALLFLVVMSLIMLGRLWPRTGDLRHAVAGYICIITGMGIAVATLPWQGNYIYIIGGAVLFILSDLVLSTEVFILPADSRLRKITPFVVWSFYWTAQFLITAGFVLRGI
ncbi:MAG: lysoplasmalogenase [Rhodobacteraceae bacterium]|nr:MAG: lysoplasmalogenase [Paracoccaceae bacterium]